MATYIYPTSSELMAIERDKLPDLVGDSPIFKHFPMRSVDTHLLSWEIQDNVLGLMGLRGLNGQPTRVKALGAKRYTMVPGVYGDYLEIDEAELTVRRPYGSWNGSINIADLVMEKQDQLLHRQFAQIKYMLWKQLTGTFTVTGPYGTFTHTDTYSVQTYAAGVAWATVATATPLYDFRAVALLSRGSSVSFGAGATAYMNRTTANALLNNTNASDLFGKRVDGGGTFNTINELNSVLLAQDLPKVEIMDDGYHDSSGTFQLFIANAKVIVVGQRTNGTPLGEFRFTRNVNNQDAGAGPYMKVIDRGENSVPRTIECHRGFSGGPVVFYPNGVVYMSV